MTTEAAAPAGNQNTEAIAVSATSESIERELAQMTGGDMSQSRGAIGLAAQGVVLNNLQDAWRFAGIIASTGLAPKGMETPAKILLAMQMGMELGLPPMASIQNIAVINGRPSIWGDVQLGLCRSKGLFDEEAYERVWDYDDNGNAVAAHCTVRRLPNGKPVTESFTIQEARQADLMGKDIWKKYTKRMLMNRAQTYALRAAFSDVLKGTLTVEEANDLPERNITPAAPTSSRPESLDDLTQQLQDSQEELDRRNGENATATGAQTAAEPARESTPAEELAAAATSDDDPLVAIKKTIAEARYAVDVNKLRAAWCGQSSKLTDAQKFEINAALDARLGEIKGKKKSSGDQGALV